MQRLRDRHQGGRRRLQVLGDIWAERRRRTAPFGAGSSAVSAFEALREAAAPIGAVCWVPPGHPVRDRPDVIAGTLPGGSSTAPGSPRSGPLLFAPLIGADGDPLGLLIPADPRSGPFPGPRQALLLETLAALTVVGLEIVRARAVERAALAVAEAQRRQLEDLLAASAQVRGYYSLDEVLREIAQAMTTAGGFRRAAIYLRMPDDALVVGATVGLTEAESRQLRETPVTFEEFAGAMQPEMLLSRSYFLDHRRFKIPPELNDKLNTPAGDREWSDGQWHPEDMLTVKIVDVDGDLLGLISVDEPVNGLIPDRAHVQAIEFFADQCAVAVTNARRYEEMKAEALTDSLTGLANRRALGRRRGSCDRPCASRRHTVHGALHRHRPFQGHQRFGRPRRGRLRAAGRRLRAQGSPPARRSAGALTEVRSSSRRYPTRTSRPRCGLPRSSGAASRRLTSDRWRVGCRCVSRSAWHSSPRSS